MNPPAHPAFVDIIRHVSNLSVANPRFAVRFLDTLLDGRAEMLWKRTRLDPKLKDVLQLAAWLESVRAEYDARNRRYNTQDGAGAIVLPDQAG
jgi:hypothetical protein